MTEDPGCKDLLRVLIARVLLATLAALLARHRWPVFLVRPSTLLCWHREMGARRWTLCTYRSWRSTAISGARVGGVGRQENPADEHDGRAL
jgi:hypothetical protein